jgi:hypothetical protein
LPFLLLQFQFLFRLEIIFFFLFHNTFLLEHRPILHSIQALT